MITMQVNVEVKGDRQVVLTLPPEVPLGPTQLSVSIASPIQPKKPRTSLADWADAGAQDWGDRIRSDDVEGFTGRRF